MIHGNGGHASVVREFYRGEGWIIAVGDNRARKKEAEACPGPFGVAVHRSAVVSPSAEIGEGTVIMAGAVVQAHARIGRHVILNTGSSCDHHCFVGDYAHIAPGARLCGNVTVGEGALVSVNVAVPPGKHIPAWSIAYPTRPHIEPL